MMIIVCGGTEPPDLHGITGLTYQVYRVGQKKVNHVRWTSYIFSGCQFPIVYMCQKLWKLASSRQSYCKTYQAYFFLAHPVSFISNNMVPSINSYNI